VIGIGTVPAQRRSNFQSHPPTRYRSLQRRPAKNAHVATTSVVPPVSRASPPGSRFLPPNWRLLDTKVRLPATKILFAGAAVGDLQAERQLYGRATIHQGSKNSCGRQGQRTPLLAAPSDPDDPRMALQPTLKSVFPICGRTRHVRPPMSRPRMSHRKYDS
jgi:hypothetical protein